MAEAAQWALVVLFGWTALGLPVPRLPPVGARLGRLWWRFRMEAEGGVGPGPGCRCDGVKPREGFGEEEE